MNNYRELILSCIYLGDNNRRGEKLYEVVVKTSASKTRKLTWTEKKVRERCSFLLPDSKDYIYKVQKFVPSKTPKQSLIKKTSFNSYFVDLVIVLSFMLWVLYL